MFSQPNLTVYFSGISADGVYQAKDFKEAMRQDGHRCTYLKQVHLDPSHWMNLAVTDVRDGKRGNSKDFFDNFIDRTNQFSDILNRGKGEICF